MTWITGRPIAHRGLHNNTAIPENSMQALEAAVRRHYPIEIDVHLLADGNIVVFHDDNLERMTGLNQPLCQQQYHNIKHLRLLDTDQHIPLLEEVLDFVNGDIPLLIELKNAGKVGKPEQILGEKIADYKGEYAVQSFNPLSLGWFKDNASHVMRGQLASDFRGIGLPGYQKFLLRRLLMNWVSAPHFIAYDIRCLPYWATTFCQSLGLPLLAWVVRSDEDWKKSYRFSDNFIFEQILP